MEKSIEIKNDTKERSSFVTVTAWIFIVIAGFGTLISLMQNIMINTMFPITEIQESMKNQPEFEKMPLFARLMMEHFQLYFMSIFVLTLTTFSSSIGLLKRKNWARKIFISIMVIGITFTIGSYILQFLFDPSSQMNLPTNEIPPEFKKMMVMMKIFMSVFTLGITGLFTWIIIKLTNREIIAEFTIQQ